MSLDPRIVRYVEERKPDGLPIREVQRLAGDASDRSYYRLRLDEGSLVLALMPAPFDPESLSFLNVARLFREIPVRIPRIQHVAAELGIVLLEDLGDALLQHEVERASREKKRELYRKAISILCRLQKRGAELRDERYQPYRLAFDESKLSAELEFFSEHFLAGFRGARLRTNEEEALSRAFMRIAAELARLPRVLCHRDYHSRNLMVVGSELAVIDFQDARMGPASYDLVSLLRDSYVDHDEDFVVEMKKEFERESSRAEIEEQFDLMSLQRNLKALGTFGYQVWVKKNDVYRKYVVRTLGLVRDNLARNRGWEDLQEVLANHLPEIA
jgi:aminoglycoside/choline kinase family phosphotransferase